MSTKQERMYEAIEKHVRQLLAIFPKATERDPMKLWRRLRRLESRAAQIGLRMCNGPEYAEGDADKATDVILSQVNALLGNRHEYQPKTGAKCGCRAGVHRDNCPNCEGTGRVIDFAAIRNRKPLLKVFVNRDPRGYALKIDDEDMRRLGLSLYSDWGGYGILAPDFSEGK